ncbi:MAG: hypothetical protein JNM56_25215 [Planctomycetia bacterium]|nr:hypothetical protein [Planctomycetia bacterium]
MSLIQQWQTAKRTFEQQTQRKKPSEKFLGIFRKSSGLESACKALDDSLKEFNVKAKTKAMAAFNQAKNTYLATLQRALGNEDENYQQQVNTLSNALDQLAADYTNAWDGVANQEFQKFITAVKNSIKAAEKNKQQLQQKLDKVEDQMQEADATWRALAAAVSTRDKEAAKKASGELQKQVKNLLAANTEVAKSYRAQLKAIDETVDSWEKHEDVIQINEDEYERQAGFLRFQRNFVDNGRLRTEEIVAESKDLLTKAAKALKEGIGNAEAEYTASIGKFARRVRDMSINAEAPLIATENLYNRLRQDLQNYQDMEPGNDKDRRKTDLQKQFNEHLKTVQQAGLKLGKAKQTLKKEWKAFPEYFKQFAEPQDVKDVNDVINGGFDNAIGRSVELTKNLRELINGLE